MQNRPKIDIAIRREEDRMNFEIGDYKLALIPVEKGTQIYDFLALEQFITRVAKESYTSIIQRDILEKNLASLNKPESTDEVSS